MNEKRIELSAKVNETNELLKKATQAKVNAENAISSDQHSKCLCDYAEHLGQAIDAINELHREIYGYSVPEDLDPELVFQHYIYNIIIKS